MFSVQRPLIAQQFFVFAFSVPTTPIPIQPQLGITTMIDSFILTIPAAAANSVWFGADAGVTVGNGLELLAGTSTKFKIDQVRQLYELQKPAVDIEAAIRCLNVQAEAIPFIVWDLSQIFLVAIAATSISGAAFKAVYI